MAFQYVTRAGDVADWIAWKQYGSRSGATEALLNANPGLADAGTTLPAGLTITLPDLPAAPARTTIRIWG